MSFKRHRKPTPVQTSSHRPANAEKKGWRPAAALAPSVAEALRSPGQPLDPSMRTAMERGLGAVASQPSRTGRNEGGFRVGETNDSAEREAAEKSRSLPASRPAAHGPGHDFSRVMVHRGAVAAASARSLQADAYTVGNHIVLGAGEHTPAAGRSLLTHELTHVLQQRSSSEAVIQRQSAGTAANPPAQPAVPRDDYVFLMGADAGPSNPFYKAAKTYYQSHLPGATMVEDIRNLRDLLLYIKTTSGGPLGNIYIISHANEDGTLSFGLNSDDGDKHLDFAELSAAFHPASGQTTLTDVSAKIDAQTKIHIKGCDIGRSQAMVELIDEVFGGAGTVTAPTHEQVYGRDSTLADAGTKRARKEKTAEFTATLPAIPPKLAALDPKLKGDERAAAMQARKDEIAARDQIIKENSKALKEQQPEIEKQAKAAGELAGTYEAISGPMFQRPGTTKFTAKELEPQVKILYDHLDKKQQAKLVAQLIATQRLDKKVLASSVSVEPRTLTEAKRAYAEAFKKKHFAATKFVSSSKSGSTLTIMVEGRVSPPGEEAFVDTLPIDTEVDSDDKIIADARAEIANPDAYTWRVASTHTPDGKTERSAVAERIMAYLHHGSLDHSAHEHFNPGEDDSRFFTTSTFAPPTPPTPP